MSSQEWKPWWKKVSEVQTTNEVDEFMRGAAGINTSPKQNATSTILLGLLAGYVGGKAASSRKWK